MKIKWWAAAVPLISLGLVSLRPSFAFDHADTPATAYDNIADIAEVYAFMRPNALADGGQAPSTHLVVVMTFAPGNTTVPPQNIDYVAHVTALDPATLAPLFGPDYLIKCSFQAGGTELLCGVNGTFLIAPVGDQADAGSPSEPIRIHAGLHSDPSFADVPAFTQTIATNTNKFTNPGTNTFQGKNVWAIVVEADVAQVFYGGDAGAALSPVLAVNAESRRK
jgi:hypothetical protein